MELSKRVIEIMQKNNYLEKELCFLCVGTDKVVGDAIGPLVGSNLKKYINKNNIKNINVIGNLDDPLINKNIENFKNIKGIKILIDSAISNSYKVGEIIVEEKSNKLVSAFFNEKNINYDISIKAIVAENSFNNTLNLIRLQNVSVKTVIKMSEKITKEMCKVIDKNCINLPKMEKI